jgi:hypothetical protein
MAWIAIVVGLFAHFVGYFLFKIELPHLSTYSDPPAYLSFIDPAHATGGESSRLAQKLLYSDSAPLFLPYELDYNWEQMQPERFLESVEATLLKPLRWELRLSPEKLLSKLPVGAAPSDASIMLSKDLWDPYQAIRNETTPTAPLPKRFAAFGFYDEASGKPVQENWIETKPATFEESDPKFKQPSEFLVWVSAEGCIGEPFLRASSGTTALDQFASGWIRDFCNRNLIQPGYYRVCFGP